MDTHFQTTFIADFIDRRFASSSNGDPNFSESWGGGTGGLPKEASENSERTSKSITLALSLKKGD